MQAHIKQKVSRLAKRQFIRYKRMGDKSLHDIIYIVVDSLSTYHNYPSGLTGAL